MNIKGALTVSAALALVGCTQVPLNSYEGPGGTQYVMQNTAQYVTNAPAQVKLSAIGYGAASSADGHTPGQRRLLAMRASKLDAYRALAEQVYGIRLTGNTTISSLMSQNDGFRAYIDAYLRGARVVSITPMAEGNYETTIEIDFDERVAQPYLTPAPSQPVMQPAGRTYVAQPTPVRTVVAQPVVTPTYVVQPPANYAAQPVVLPRRPMEDGLRGAAGPGRVYGSSFYYAE